MGFSVLNISSLDNVLIGKFSAHYHVVIHTFMLNTSSMDNSSNRENSVLIEVLVLETLIDKTH